MARRKPMQARGGEYFTNYAKTRGLHMTPMHIAGQPACCVNAEAKEGAGAQGLCRGAEVEGRQGGWN